MVTGGEQVDHDPACTCVLAVSPRSFDCCTLKPGEGAVTTDFKALLATLNGANCDYTIHSQM